MRRLMSRATFSAVLVVSCGAPSIEPPAPTRSGGGRGDGSAGATSVDPGAGGGPGFALPDAAPTDASGAPPAPTEMANCGIKTLDLKSGPGDLLLVLDRSG